jgi:uncharacterized protein YutE (UPF0331/DUF86 family)
MAHGIEVASPKKTFQELFKQKSISQEETTALIGMAEDRNTTTHMYDEVIIEQLSNKMKAHYVLMNTIIRRLQWPASAR